MEIKSKPMTGYFLNYDDWAFDWYVTVKYRMKIMEGTDENEYVLLVQSDELVDGNNEFITCKSIALVFSSTEEIDQFIELIYDKSINEFKNKPKKEDLFK